MFKRVLVPLDGSERAEMALPLAAHIARHTGGTIQLLSVVTHPLDSGAYLTQPVNLSEHALEMEISKAQSYLKEAAALPGLSGVTTETEVLVGLPAQTILSYIDTQDVDLVIMGSHGDTGLKRWFLGRIAPKVIRHSSVPVVVLHAEGTPTTIGETLHVLVPLDGSPLAETILEPVAQLAAVLSAPAQGAIHLLQVLHPPRREMDDVAEHATLDVIKENALKYLRTQEKRLRESALAHYNLAIDSSVLIEADIPKVLVDLGEYGMPSDTAGVRKGFSLIAMATHGRSGPQRLVMGSVTEKVLGATKLPLLIVHPKAVAAQATQKETATDTKDQPWVGLL